MEVTTEVTIEGWTTCPECGHIFEVELTGEATIEIEPEDYINEGYD